MSLTYAQIKRARLNYQFFFHGCKNINLVGITYIDETTGDWNKIRGKHTAKLQRFGRN